MLKFTTKATVILSAMTLAGCMPHLTREQCLSMNWKQIGFSDGAQGHGIRDLTQDIQDCAKFKLSVNQRGYRRGWNEGIRGYCRPSMGYKTGSAGQNLNTLCPSDLMPRFEQQWKRGIRTYCTPDTGYSLGRNGHSLPSFCPADLARAFTNAYMSGHRIHDLQASLQSQVNSANDEINQLKDQINDKNNDITKWQDVLNQHTNDHKADRFNRRMARDNIRDDQRDIDNLNHDLDRTTAHRDYLQNQLTHVKLHP